MMYFYLWNTNLSQKNARIFLLYKLRINNQNYYN